MFAVLSVSPHFGCINWISASSDSILYSATCCDSFATRVRNYSSFRLIVCRMRLSAANGTLFRNEKKGRIGGKTSIWNFELDLWANSSNICASEKRKGMKNGCICVVANRLVSREWWYLVTNILIIEAQILLGCEWVRAKYSALRCLRFPWEVVKHVRNTNECPLPPAWNFS